MLLSRLLQKLIRTGELTVIDAAGEKHRFGDGEPAITIRLHDRRLHWRLFLQPELAAGEAYMDGTLTVENASLYDFLDLIGRNIEHSGAAPLGGPVAYFKRLFRRFYLFNSRTMARKNVARHYDLSPKLYDLFADPERHYSCAYFIRDDDDVDTAQYQKCRHIAAKLLLEPGLRVLDIGSGWGGLACYLAERFGVDVAGITLSEEQLKFAEEQAKRRGLSERARFHLRDYRDERGRYDRIVSVGMFEHVGTHHYDTYFKGVRDCLADDGVALIHTIVHLDPPNLPSPWVRKYIFPGGYIPAFSEVVPAIERSGLIVTDVEVLRLHYAEMLRQWRVRFLARREEAKALYDERFCRMWEFYMAGFEMAFRYMKLCVVQIQMAKRHDAVPITRDYMVDTERAYAAAEEPERPARRRSA